MLREQWHFIINCTTYVNHWHACVETTPPESNSHWLLQQCSYIQFRGNFPPNKVPFSKELRGSVGLGINLLTVFKRLNRQTLWPKTHIKTTTTAATTTPPQRRKKTLGQNFPNWIILKTLCDQVKHTKRELTLNRANGLADTCLFLMYLIEFNRVGNKRK